MDIIIGMQFRRFIILVTMFALAFTACTETNEPRPKSGGSTIARAAEQRKSDVQVEGEGIVSRVLSDDRQGSRHQRFVVRLPDGQTVLIQHNIDLAPRIDGIREGDAVSFFGEYVWNEQGGLVHWTHHDPAGRHVGGWIKHKGRTYE